MVNGKCEKYIPPYCENEETIVDYDYRANVNYVSLGRNLLYLRRYAKGCNYCLDNYLAVEISLASTTLGLYHQYVCLKSGYLENITNQAE